MPPQALLTYAQAAKKAGATEAARQAMFMLWYRQDARMRKRIRNRIPKHLLHAEDTVASWVLERVLKSALKLQLKGESMGEWVVWWQKAIDRQVVSFWRSKQGKAIERETQLPSEHQTDEGDGRHTPDRLGEDLDIDRLLRQVESKPCITGALGKLGPEHETIVWRRYWGDWSSAEIADDLGIGVAKVDKVAQRFRDAVRTCLQQQGLGS